MMILSPTPCSWPNTPRLYHPSYHLHCWLLGILIDLRPPTTKAPPFSIFFDGACIGSWCPTPNRETNQDTAKPDGTHLLAWDKRKQQHHDLGAPLPCGWRERSMLLEGKWEWLMLVAVCCVWCFCELCLCVLATFNFLTCKKVRIDWGFGLQNGWPGHKHKTDHATSTPSEKMYTILRVQGCCALAVLRASCITKPVVVWSIWFQVHNRSTMSS